MGLLAVRFHLSVRILWGDSNHDPCLASRSTFLVDISWSPMMVYYTRGDLIKTLVIVAFAVVLASCSYEFDEPPFPKDELTKITETELGKELLSHIGNFPDIE